MSNKDEEYRSLLAHYARNSILSEYGEEFLLAMGIEFGISQDEAKDIIQSALIVCAEQGSRFQGFRDSLQKEAKNGFPLAKAIEDDLRDGDCQER